jgi:hypothetical protein
MSLHDPTAWRTPEQAYEYWVGLALSIEKDLYLFEASYRELPTIQGRRKSEQTQMMVTDARYRQLSGDLKDAHMMAAFWAGRLQVKLLRELVIETRFQPGYDPHRPNS